MPDLGHERIAVPHDSAALLEELRDIKGRRLSHVVDVGLVRDPKQTDPGAEECLPAMSMVSTAPTAEKSVVALRCSESLTALAPSDGTSAV